MINVTKYRLSDNIYEWRRDDNDLLHREDGPAYITPYGYEAWYLNGLTHRKGAPAVTWPDGMVEWWWNGKCHRSDGPAIIHSDGTVFWWLFGVKYDTIDEWAKELLFMFDTEEFVMLKLQYG